VYLFPDKVLYSVTDLQAAKIWYTQILNAAPILDSPFSVVFKIGETFLILINKTDASSSLGSEVQVYWRVQDVYSALEILLASGAKPHTKIKTILGSAFGSVVDPFGNVIGISGQSVALQKRIVDEAPSETAMAVAFMRALANIDEHQEIRGGDALAEIFLTSKWRKPVRDLGVRKWVLDKIAIKGIYEYILVRTAHFDSVVRNAFEENVPQVVFLGAGYDSRPYRFMEYIRDTLIFELDSTPTQLRKKDILANKQIHIPDQLTYVPIDFRRDSILDILLQAGFDPNKQTLFLWEGVMYYLTQEVVDSMFNFLKDKTTTGSSILFDYISKSPDDVFNPDIMTFLKALAGEYAAEPILMSIPRGNINNFLSSRGLSLKAHVEPFEMEQRYLTLKNGSVVGHVPPVFAFAHAEVD
jgi:methyltransferase (TIGR00027 family)